MCPCCSGKPYAECCQPFHKGAEPPTPETLMRSRYSAFALKQTDHLWSTMHSTHPDRLRSRDNVIRELKKNCNRYSYPQLEILKVEEPGADGAAYVTFRAGVLDGAQAVGFVERSRFLKEAEGWRYVDGTPGTP